MSRRPTNDPIESAKVPDFNAGAPPEVSSLPPRATRIAEEISAEPVAAPPPFVIEEPGALPAEIPAELRKQPRWRVLEKRAVQIGNIRQVLAPGKVLNEHHYPEGTIELLVKQGLRLEAVAD